MPRALLLLALAGCADDAPDPCARMCDAAAALYGGCLEEWGAGWEAAGYEDDRDFLGSCETWAWQLRVLEEDAVETGEIAEGGQVDAVCRERAADLSAEDAACEAFTSLDWHTPPWRESADTGAP